MSITSSSTNKRQHHTLVHKSKALPKEDKDIYPVTTPWQGSQYCYWITNAMHLLAELMMNNQTSMQAGAPVHKENTMPQSTTLPTVQARRHWLPRQLAACAHTVLVLGLVVYLGCLTPKIPCLSVLAAFRTSSLPCRIMAQNSVAAAAADQAAAIRSSTSIHIPAAAESACS
jgi:hypothetical protein